MAGDWIKMRVDLPDDPAVVQMADHMEMSEDEVVGKLHRLWSWADRHTTDGLAPGITSRWVDKYVGKSGFGECLCQVGWLAFSPDGVAFPHFDRHNGITAKRRCDAVIRQRLSRENRDNRVTGLERDVIPRPFRSLVLARDSFRCIYCGIKSTPEREDSRKRLLSIDHIVPMTRGGRTTVDNLACCCKLCNDEKNDRTPEEWGITPAFLSEGVTYLSQKICDNRVTREEKRREENIHTQGRKRPGVCVFIPPTVEEVAAYVATRKVKISPEEFVDHYTANGWMVGKVGMKDWRASVRTWEKNRLGGKDTPPSVTPVHDAKETIDHINELAEEAKRNPMKPLLKREAS